MKFVFLSIGLFISLNLYAQEEAKPRFAIDFGLSASSDVTFDPFIMMERCYLPRPLV
jgi:hypothetical protein